MTAAEKFTTINVAESKPILPTDISANCQSIHIKASTECPINEDITRLDPSDPVSENILDVDHCSVGVRVKRGRDWIFGEQDYYNGKPGLGTIIDWRDDLWARVEWDN